MDDVAPVISNASFDKDIYAASDSASLSLVLDPSSINILGYSDIDVVHVKELPVGSWIDLSKISEEIGPKRLVRLLLAALINMNLRSLILLV